MRVVGAGHGERANGVAQSAIGFGINANKRIVRTSDVQLGPTDEDHWVQVTELKMIFSSKNYIVKNPF